MAKSHKVKGSDHISAIAIDHGISLWQTVWLDEGNASLRSKRANPNLLFKGDRKAPGDVLTVPGQKKKNAPAAAGKMSKFKIPMKPLYLRLRILDADFGPIKNADYELKIEGVVDPRKGKTDDKGQIKEQIPPEARKATLGVQVPADSMDEPSSASSSPPPSGDASVGSPAPDLKGDLPISWELQIGALNPILEAAPNTHCISGVQARLNNLGMNAGPVDGILGENTRAAVTAFQGLYGLAKDGHPNVSEMQPKLKAVHDDPDSLVPPPPASDTGG